MARRHGSMSVVVRCCAILLGLLCGQSAATAQNGACCDPITGTCISTDQCTCVLNGGGWQGTGSVCNPGFICPPVGACCTANGCTTVDPTLCANLGGTFITGNTCPVAVCPPQQTGACCCRQSMCINTDQDLCTFMNGIFQAGQTCTNVNPCLGACCGPGTQCILTMPSACVAPQTWLGTPTCSPNPCLPPGFVACCLNGTCTTASYCDCVFKNGVPFPAGTVCTAATCVSAVAGACCTSNGICVTTNANFCVNSLGGSWVAGTCPIAACPNNPPFTCCCNGACKFTDPTMCAIAGGTVFPVGTSCNTQPCSGACCNPNTGACAAPVSQNQCNSAGGNYLPGVLTCAPNPCTGACCDPATGNCFQSVLTACPVPPFLFFGVGSTCTATNCPKPTSACCDTITGQCTIITGTSCPTPTQIWMGVNSTCTPNPCVVCCDPNTGNCTQILPGTTLCPSNTIQYPGLSCTPNNPCPPQTGACCFAPNTGLPPGCVAGLTQAQCQAPNLWLGVGSTCVPDKCPGACCNPQTGFCVYIAASQCPFPVPPPFLYLTACTPNNPCPQPPPLGACCDQITGQCSYVAQGACSSLTSIWLGSTSTCSPNPCLVCCDPNTGNCFPIPVGATNCNGLNPLPTTSGCAPNNPCPPATPTGACCAPSGLCTVGPASACVAPSIYLGNGTVCGIGTCLVCCNPTTGICYPPITIFGVPMCKGGALLSFGTTCVPNPCPPPGACCKPTGQCVQATQANCQPPNIWAGAGTTCTPNRCYRCCLNGTCYTPFVFGGTFACISGSTVVVGTTCTPNPCPIPTGACCTGTKYGCQPTGNICNQVTQAQCAQMQGQWQGANVPCQSPPGNFKACCKANFNGTGGVNVGDVFSFLSAWFAQVGMMGTNPPLTADFNCSGKVTVQDVFDFLTAWFAKCF